MSDSINLKKLITEIPSENHYLRKSCVHFDEYIDGLILILNKLYPVISREKQNSLLRDKLQLFTSDFKEKQYIQAVCELSTMNDFVGGSECHFIYENSITGSKDADFTIKTQGVSINVEIKCPSFSDRVNSDKEHVLIHPIGRASEKEVYNSAINEISKRLNYSGKNHVIQKSMDNNLKDFLLSAQGKFCNASKDDINVLVVCCDSAIDMQSWRTHLLGPTGFFTEKTFISRFKYNRVDFVLLTNLYNRHHKFYDCSTLGNRWKLSKAFNLLYPNRYSLRNEYL